MEQATEPNPMERPSGSGFGAAQSENDEQYSRERKERTRARQSRDGDQRYVTCRVVSILNCIKFVYFPLELLLCVSLEIGLGAWERK